MRPPSMLSRDLSEGSFSELLLKGCRGINFHSPIKTATNIVQYAINGTAQLPIFSKHSDEWRPNSTKPRGKKNSGSSGNNRKINARKAPGPIPCAPTGDCTTNKTINDANAAPKWQASTLLTEAAYGLPQNCLEPEPKRRLMPVGGQS